MSVAESLPFGFIGMLFGEAMFSEAGAFLFLVKARSQAATADIAVTVALLICVIIIVVESSLRRISYCWASRAIQTA